MAFQGEPQAGVVGGHVFADLGLGQQQLGFGRGRLVQQVAVHGLHRRAARQPARLAPVAGQ
ncbi:hypothetical protein D3C87_1397580 [compost metagenome]